MPSPAVPPALARPAGLHGVVYGAGASPNDRSAPVRVVALPAGGAVQLFRTPEAELARGILPKEASVFQIANSRFWEAAFLPMAVLVVVALSSCADLWMGRFVSLSSWYGANLYSMSYALQVLHPQVPTLKLASLSPFGSASALCIWSVGIAVLELVVGHVVGQRQVGQVLGTTFYGLCGCLGLHASLAPGYLTSLCRPHKLLRYAAEHRLFELPTWQLPPSTTMVEPVDVVAFVPRAHAGSSDTASGSTSWARLDDLGEPPHEVTPPRPSRRPARLPPLPSFGLAPAAAPGTCAGHVAVLVGCYGLIVAWRCAAGLTGAGPVPAAVASSTRGLAASEVAISPWARPLAGVVPAAAMLGTPVTVAQLENLAQRPLAAETANSTSTPQEAAAAELGLPPLLGNRSSAQPWAVAGSGDERSHQSLRRLDEAAAGDAIGAAALPSDTVTVAPTTQSWSPLPAVEDPPASSEDGAVQLGAAATVPATAAAAAVALAAAVPQVEAAAAAVEATVALPVTAAAAVEAELPLAEVAAVGVAVTPVASGPATPVAPAAEEPRADTAAAAPADSEVPTTSTDEPTAAAAAVAAESPEVTQTAAAAAAVVAAESPKVSQTAAAAAAAASAESLQSISAPPPLPVARNGSVASPRVATRGAANNSSGRSKEASLEQLLRSSVAATTRRRRPPSRAEVPRRRPPAPALPARGAVPAAAALEHQAVAHAWRRVLLVGAFALVVLTYVDYGKPYEFSVPYLICYNLLCLRVPDLLGHAVISAFDGLHRTTSPALITTGISFAYMAAMQAYLFVLSCVCTNMSAMHIFPRFYFVAQMYYYLFWYMMLMVVSPGGVEERSFWVMVAMLNGSCLLSNLGVVPYLYAVLRHRVVLVEPPLKTLFDSKVAAQDQLADVVSLLIVPAIATSFHICNAASVAQYNSSALISLWQRFGALLLARLLSGLLTEEIFRRRLDVLHKADVLELQLLPMDSSQNRQRYLNDICVGPKLTLEAMRNIERCELYFCAVAVSCAFSVFQHGDEPVRYAFIAFGK